MQAYINLNALYDKKSKASKHKEFKYVHVLQPKADHQGSKNNSKDFRWTGPYIVEKTLPNNNYLAREIEMDRTQVVPCLLSFAATTIHA